MMDGYGMDAGDWFWMAPMMVLFIVVLGLTVYAAVRIAHRQEHR